MINCGTPFFIYFLLSFTIQGVYRITVISQVFFVVFSVISNRYEIKSLFSENTARVQCTLQPVHSNPVVVNLTYFSLHIQISGNFPLNRATFRTPCSVSLYPCREFISFTCLTVIESWNGLFFSTTDQFMDSS